MGGTDLERTVESLNIMSDLVSMTEESFKECVEYVEKADFSERVREFLEYMLDVAKAKRSIAIDFTVNP